VASVVPRRLADIRGVDVARDGVDKKTSEQVAQEAAIPLRCIHAKMVDFEDWVAGGEGTRIRSWEFVAERY
jgi:hypothetical protein